MLPMKDKPRSTPLPRRIRSHLDGDDGQHTREAAQVLFEGIYALGAKCGADLEKIRAHEEAIVRALLDGQRRRTLHPVRD